jgi:uncharacterized membrane protein YeaQ/YmgE (transglycosylase-associated protein family)
MSILAWMVLGLIVGFVANKIVNKAGEGVAMDIALGVVGAVLGGGLFHQFGSGSVTGLNLWTLLVAATGAVVVLMGYHTIVGPGAATDLRQ